MRGYFWSNTVWYGILFLISLAVFTVVQVRADNRRFVTAFTAAVLGLYYLFEYVLVALADAYRYHPMLVPDDPFQDTVLGNIFSQTSIAVICAAVIVLRPRPPWYLAIAAAYYGIELLFIRLGIYAVHWYRPIFTPIILVPLIAAGRRWHNRAALAKSRGSEDAVIFLGALAVAGNTCYLPMKLLRIHVFTGGFFEDPSRDHTTTLILYSVILIGWILFVYRSGRRWYWKLLMLAVPFALQYAAAAAGLMVFRRGWFVWATALEVGVIFFWVNVLGRMARARRPSADGLPR